jgi:hypothetical protein
MDQGPSELSEKVENSLWRRMVTQEVKVEGNIREEGIDNIIGIRGGWHFQEEISKNGAESGKNRRE